ncbi:MAG: hypothetical protein F6K48_03355 [Okeania sp. SIO3H1]|nr:hypothetical protein [Okeania sp. SIO3H1]
METYVIITIICISLFGLWALFHLICHIIDTNRWKKLPKAEEKAEPSPEELRSDLQQKRAQEALLRAVKAERERQSRIREFKFKANLGLKPRKKTPLQGPFPHEKIFIQGLGAMIRQSRSAEGGDGGSLSPSSRNLREASNILKRARKINH